MGEYICNYCQDSGLLTGGIGNKGVPCFYCEIRNKARYIATYYHSGTYEAINVIEAWGLNFSLGNVIKYVARAGRKTDNPIEDLEKAKWYIEREIEKLKQK
jgi:translation initiation factor 2B subunit (eIF-2B alpha/beta/delta family)